MWHAVGRPGHVTALLGSTALPFEPFVAAADLV